MQICRTTRRYKTKKANWSQFHAKLDQLKIVNNINSKTIQEITNKSDIDKIVTLLTTLIVQTCDDLLPKKKATENLRIPWWSEELGILKRGVATSKRRIRSASSKFRDQAIEQYLKAKEEYENRAKSAQISSWKDFCSKQNKEGMWEGIYRVIRNTKRREEDMPLVENGGTAGPQGISPVASKTTPETRRRRMTSATAGSGKWRTA